MKFWKPASALFMSAMLVTTTGCSNDNGAEASGDLDGTTITVGIWHGNDTEEAAREEVFSSFEEKTGINVDVRVYTDFETQLKTDLVGGTAPDVFYVDAFLAPSLIAEGVLTPLDDFIANTEGFDVEDFYVPALEAFQGTDGGQYGLPKDLSTLGLFYNERLLEEAGVSPDDIPTEAADLPAFLADLQEKLPEGVVAGLTTAELSRHMFMLQANGTNVADDEGYAVLTEADQLEYLQMLIDAYQDGIIQRPVDLGHGWSGDSFGSESAAIMIEGNWAIAHIQQNFPDVEFGTREVPTMAGHSGSMMFTVSYAMNAASENQEAAWEFINYVTGTEGMTTAADIASLIPSRQSSSEELDLENHELLAPFAAAASYATPWQKGTTLSIIFREYNNLLPVALTGEMTLEEAMNAAEEAANRDISTQLR